MREIDGDFLTGSIFAERDVTFKGKAERKKNVINGNSGDKTIFVGADRSLRLTVQLAQLLSFTFPNGRTSAQVVCPTCIVYSTMYVRTYM